MTTLREAAQQALEALEGGADSWQLVGPAIDALRAALAEPVQEPVQEPVAWMMVNPKHQRLSKSLHWKPQTDWHITWESVPLYATPPQRKPLTEEEISNIWDGHIVPIFGKNGINPVVFARAIERVHNIKE